MSTPKSGRIRIDLIYLLHMSVSAVHLLQPEAEDASLLSDHAYYRLRELIVTLELPPGSVVDEKELIDRLGLGRTPIREALRALAREGLVEVYPRRGMLVSAVDAGDLTALTEARLVLEGQAARLAAERSTGEDRTVTQALLGELGRARGGAGQRALIELDQRVHRHVYAATHNQFIESTLGGYYVLALRIWFLALDRIPVLGDAVGEHQAILEAIAAGDGQRAEAAMRRHVEGFDTAVRSVL